MFTLSVFGLTAPAHADLLDGPTDVLFDEDPIITVITPEPGTPLQDHTAQDEVDPPVDDDEKPGKDPAISPWKDEPKDSDRPGRYIDHPRLTPIDLDPYGHSYDLDLELLDAMNDRALHLRELHQPIGDLSLTEMPHLDGGSLNVDDGLTIIGSATSASVPTPGALIIIGAGALCARRRRRH